MIKNLLLLLFVKLVLAFEIGVNLQLSELVFVLVSDDFDILLDLLFLLQLSLAMLVIDLVEPLLLFEQLELQVF